LKQKGEELENNEKILNDKVMSLQQEVEELTKKNKIFH